MGNNDSQKQGKTKRNKTKKALKYTLIGFFSLWAVVLILIQIILTPKFIGNIVDKYAAEFVDGELSFDKIDISIFRNFPNLNVTIDSLSVSYPNDRFGAHSSSEWYTQRGRSQEADTLVSLDRLSASLNVASLVIGKINVPKVILSKPRIFATAINDSTATWNVIKLTGSNEGSDTVSTGMPDIKLGKIRMDRNPVIIFGSVQDSMKLALRMNQMALDGKLDLKNPESGRISFRIDSMFVSGRFPTDTIGLGLDMLKISEENRIIEAEAEATSYFALRSMGRMKIPIGFTASVQLPESLKDTISIPSFTATVASIPLIADAKILFGQEGIYMKGSGRINGCKIQDAISYFGKNLWAGIEDYHTDATINLKADFDGRLDSKGSMPELKASLSIPRSVIRHKSIGGDNAVRLLASVKGDTAGVFNLSLDSLMFSGCGLDFKADGSVKDLTGKDPGIRTKGSLAFDAGTFSELIDTTGSYDAEGGLSADFEGSFKLSELTPAKIGTANLKAKILSDKIRFSSAKDSIGLHIDSLDVWVGTVSNSYDKSIRQGERMLAIVALTDSLDIDYKNSLILAGKEVSLKAQNSASILDSGDSAAFSPFGGRFEARNLFLKDSESTSISVLRTDNIFKISPQEDATEVPVLTLNSKTKGLFMRTATERLGGKNADIHVTAAMNTVAKKRRMNKFLDSLAKVYPDVPRDSLFRHAFKGREQRTAPAWMSEDDFKKKDLDFKLDQNLAKYYRDWDIDGKVSLERANLITPRFPLNNVLYKVGFAFNNNEIDINSVNFASGESMIGATGKVSGLRRALLRNGAIDIDLKIKSDRLNVDELLSAYTKGSTFDVSELEGAEEMDDNEYQSLIVADSLATDDSVSALMVIPANINATIALNASKVKYSNLMLNKMVSTLVVKERCVQFTNTTAASNVGNMSFEGFYSTRTKKDLKTGFNLSFSNITSEKVIEMIPEIDTIMPMLKSFKGKLSCELAATADIDTTMAVVMPSINGVIRLKGNNLTLQNDPTIKQLAKLLKFKDKKTIHIDKMSVEGMIADSKLEIFPFVLDIDRYSLAMSGIQNMDSSFKYHISVLESPLLFRMGIDLNGDFDNMKFKIGKAKYKSRNVPVFSAAIDQTKLNLTESIRNIFLKGVDNAVNENKQQQAINAYKSEISYVAAANTQLDSLSSAEQAALSDSTAVTEATESAEVKEVADSTAANM